MGVSKFFVNHQLMALLERVERRWCGFEEASPENG
jgi:hypothetical protein